LESRKSSGDPHRHLARWPQLFPPMPFAPYRIWPPTMAALTHLRSLPAIE
jgi:hypothetical protein